LVDDRISIGDFIVTGGELPAMLVVDAVTRLIPNVLEKDTATDFESFSLSSDQQLLLEYPQYTRPEEFHGWKVPEVLLTGHHDNIENWRMEKAKETTKKIRPDLTK
jgi:tRNA (guanine37-N1)-methyltransferase